MISLNKFLKGRAKGEDALHVRALSLLLQGIELHTLDYHKEDYERFRSDLSRIQDKLFPKTPNPELLVLVGGAIKIFEDYNRRTAGRLRAQFLEWQSIISAFTTAVEAMVSASDASLVRLHEIQTELSAAERIDDLRLLKTHLCTCLNGIASDVAEHRKNSASSMVGLTSGPQDFVNPIDPVEPQLASDPVTGLPVRAEAEAALCKIAGGGAAAVVVVFALKRLKQVNGRFGYEVGDGLLAQLSAFLGSDTQPEQVLYRWSGPALLAIITSNVPCDRIRQEIGSLVARMPEHEVVIGARAVMIPVSLAWTVFPVSRPVDRLVHQLEAFVLQQSSEDSYTANTLRSLHSVEP